MRRTLVVSVFLLAFAVTFAGVTRAAQAEVVQYMSRHPIPKRVGHGFCDIDVPHFHDYPPSDPRLYRQVNGEYYFVGDPTPFDYDGPRYSFYGPHPITDAGVQFGGPAYCYIRGPHYHWYAPPPQAQFEMRGGAYWYVGAYDPVYYDDQPRFVVINDVYAPMVYARPVIDIQIAPPEFRGELVVGGGPGGWRTVREGPAFRRGPGFHGPGPGFERRDMAMHERREEEHRNWEQREHGHGFGPGPHGGPPERGGGWHAGPPERGGGWHGGPPPERGGGWHGGPERGGPRGGPAGPAPSRNGWHAGSPHGGAGPGPGGGGWHAGGGGGQHPAPHGNGFHR
jgi:hypothetical protein